MLVLFADDFDPDGFWLLAGSGGRDKGTGVCEIRRGWRVFTDNSCGNSIDRIKYKHSVRWTLSEEKNKYDITDHDVWSSSEYFVKFIFDTKIWIIRSCQCNVNSRHCGGHHDYFIFEQIYQTKGGFKKWTVLYTGVDSDVRNIIKDKGRESLDRLGGEDCDRNCDHWNRSGN